MRGVIDIFLILLFKNSIGSSFNVSNTDLSLYKPQREGRFIGWALGLGLVRFENAICTGGDGFDGTCYTRWQCKSIGGVFAGKCRSVGTCCVLTQSCGTSSSYNNTYFVNSGFPQTYSGGGACTFTIQKCNSDICQVRLDLLSLSLAQPNAIGVCDRDSLSITGGGSRFTPICGENSGLHIYMPFSGSEDIKITIATSSAVTFQRSWKIKVAQIDCSSAYRAPSGCLMYYTSSTGTARSFNYGTTVSTGTRQIANTNYGICVAKLGGICGITWSPSANDPFAFTVSNSTVTPTMLQGTACTGDFVVISNPVGFTADRFCGTTLNPITTNAAPYVLTVVTDGVEDPAFEIGNRGFSLDWSEVACN